VFLEGKSFEEPKLIWGAWERTAFELEKIRFIVGGLSKGEDE